MVIWPGPISSTRLGPCVEAELADLYRMRDPERAAKFEALSTELRELEYELDADDAPPSKTRH